MRDLSNLERLLKLKNEATNINNEIKLENQKLLDKRCKLVKDVLEDFIQELAELSKYGSAGHTGIEMTFYRSSYGYYPQIIHKAEKNRFMLLANPSVYDCLAVLYDSESGWNWQQEKTKKFIALNKNVILNAIEEKITQSITRYIENSETVDENMKLKKEIKQLLESK